MKEGGKKNAERKTLKNKSQAFFSLTFRNL